MIGPSGDVRDGLLGSLVPGSTHPVWNDLRRVLRRWGIERAGVEIEWIDAGTSADLAVLGVARRLGSARCLLGVEVGRGGGQPLQHAPFLALPLLACGVDYRVCSWLGLPAPVGTVIPVSALRGPDLEAALRVAAGDLAGFHDGAGAGSEVFGTPVHGDFVVRNLTAVGQPDRLVMHGWSRSGAGSRSRAGRMPRDGADALALPNSGWVGQVADLCDFVSSLMALTGPGLGVGREDAAELVTMVLGVYAAERGVSPSLILRAVRATADTALAALLDEVADRRMPSGAAPPALTFDWPLYGEPEQRALSQALGSADVSWPTGATRRLEESVSDCLGARHVVAHANGTSAMFSAMVAAGVGPGDEVVCPSYTWWASVSPALWCGARVVFCEVSDDMVVDVDDLARTLSTRTRAVVVPHLWGALAPVERVRSVCGSSVVVIEDASHAFGTHRDGVLAGTAGDLGVLSLQAHKPLPAGEGGLLLTSDPALFERSLVAGHYERLRALEEQDLRALAATGLGLKFRMSPLHAAVALAQLERIVHRLARQDALVRAVAGELKERSGGRVVGADAAVRHGGRAGLRLVLDGRLAGQRDAVLEELAAAGVRAERDYLRPLHLAPLFTRTPRPVSGTAVGVGAGALPRTEELCDRLVALPLPTGGSVAAARVMGQKVAGVLQNRLGPEPPPGSRG